MVQKILHIENHSIQSGYLEDINKLLLKFLWKDRRPRRANTGLKENSNVGGLLLADFKTYKKFTALKTMVQEKAQKDE